MTPDANADQDPDFYAKLLVSTNKTISPDSLAASNASVAKFSFSKALGEFVTLAETGTRVERRLRDVLDVASSSSLLCIEEIKKDNELYGNLLWKSKDLAGTASVVVEDFREVMIPMIWDANVAAADKARKLEGWINAMETKTPDMDAHMQAFEDFHSSLQELLNNVETELKTKGKEVDKTAEGQLAELQKIDDQISDLEVNVMKPIHKFLELGNGVFGAFFLGTPVTAFAAMIVAIGAGVVELYEFHEELKDADEKRQVLEKQKAALKEEISSTEDVQARLKNAAILPSTIHVISHSVREYKERVVTVINVIPKITTDVGRIKTYLDEGSTAFVEGSLEHRRFKAQMDSFSTTLSAYSRLLSKFRHPST